MDWTVQSTFLPNTSVFQVRLTLSYSNYILNQYLSALSINLIVVKQRMMFHRLHKHRRRTLWMPCTSEDSPRWKTFSKGGLCSTPLLNQHGKPWADTVLTQHEENHISWAVKPEPSNWLVLLFHICKSPCPCTLIEPFWTFLCSHRSFSRDLSSKCGHTMWNYCTNFSLGTLTTYMLSLLAKYRHRQKE